MKRVFILLLLIFILSATAIAESAAQPDVFRLPSALKDIGEEAFIGIDTDQIVLPDGVETIGARAFAQSGATSVNLPASLTSIADDAFEGCELTEVRVTDNTYAYNWAAKRGFVSADYCFEIDEDGNATLLSSVVAAENCFEVPDEICGHPVVGIGRDLWKNQANLVRLVLPDTISFIGEGAFSGCGKLAAVVFSGSDAVISEGAFADAADALTFYAVKNTDAQRYAGVIGASFVETGIGDRYLLIVAPDAQSSEEAEAAEKIAKRNPTGVILLSTSASLTDAEIQSVMQAAGNPDLKAIIAAPAPEGLAAPFAGIRTNYGRDDLLLTAGNMYGVSDELAAVCDFCVELDGAEIGKQIAGFAASRQCAAIVVYTCPGESSTKTMRALTSALSSSFSMISTVECPDPDQVGVQKAAQFIQADIEAGMKQVSGARICFFCSDDRLQSAMEQTISANASAYMALPFTPSPYAGFQQAFNLSGSGSKADVIQEIASALIARNASGRFSTWGVSPRTLMVESVYNYALQVAGGVAEPLNPQAFAACMSECAEETVNCAANGNRFDISLSTVDFGTFDETVTYRALIIGEYNNVSGISNNLPFTTKNCSFMYATLAASSIDGQRYTIVRDTANPGKAKIQSLIQTTFAEADDNDVSLIYIVSHGYVNTNYGYYFGIPKAKVAVSEEVYSWELLQWLQPIQGSVVLILDSCKSGAFISDMDPYLDQCGNISVLTAQTADQNASYYVGTDSANTMEFLTYAYTKGLGYNAGYETPGLYADSNRDNLVTVRESFDYAATETVTQVNAKRSTFNPKSDYGLKIPNVDTQAKLNAWYQQPQTYKAEKSADVVIFGK